ncbi:TetR/AcrR family transcriptional regulator [Granulicella mallensis]|uniref:Transcriptional regulator, TetR family n=1 Tax=Granulicella mallensis (strain ATCC BAA-1857 / DSM 23137 / MP5ACTX8) TaxID=682795 RepID=G8NXH4_GRAMM|nr:TetR/AcrR family transcriptional regulator [Granulicella mallensis]AEU38969.1 transcriptional regulator, TetR family [Granulicella mallensis MP5ACTX8]
MPSVSKPSSSRRVLTDLRRREILAAAIKVFGKKGFADTRAEDVAAAAKIAKGTLYLYFKSKEDIYATAVLHAIGQLQSLVAERVSEASGVRDKLAAAIAIRLKFWLDQENLYRLLLTVGREQKHRRQTNDVLRVGHDSLLAIFEEGVASGELPPGNFDTLSWAILDMVRGCNERRLDGLTDRTPQQDADFIIETALQSLGI